MKVLFLGTGASDWPVDKVECNQSRYRRNSSILIDDTILIDPGPGVYEAACEYGVNLWGVKYILNTHKHADHFNINTLNLLEKYGAKFVELEAGEKRWLDNYQVHALKGNHRCTTTHFLISDGVKRIFYGLDGAWLMYDEVQAIKEYPVDLAILDGTVGNIEGDYRIFEHNNLMMVRELKKSLETYVFRFCISHMAYTLHEIHEDLTTEMSQYGIEVAYDGMTIEV